MKRSKLTLTGDGVERPGHPRLLVPGDARHVVQVEHASAPRWAPGESRPAAGVAAWIWSRIFSRTAVALIVVKTLAVTTSSRPDPGMLGRLQGVEQILAVLLQGGVVPSVRS